MSPAGPQAPADVATELVQELVRVFKVRRLYGPDHPQRAEVEATAASRIAALLAEEGSVELQVDETSLLGGGEVVYEQAAGPESLAHIMFREGLREIVFHEGLTATELAGFLDEVATASQQRADAEYDLVARLWEQRFVHVRYRFVEALSDEDWVPPAEERAKPPIPLQIQLSDDDRAALERPPTVMLADPTLYFLDDDDMAELQGGLEEEKGRALFVDVLTCLRELMLEPIVEEVTPAIEVIEEIHAGYLKDEIYRRVIEIHEIFAPYLDGEAPEAARAAFGRMREAVLSEDAMARLSQRLLAGELDEEEVSAFVRWFGAGRVQGLLAAVPEIKRLCQFPQVAAAFSDVAREDETGLRRALTSGDPRQALTAAFVTGLTGDTRQLDALGETLESGSPEVRREALLALKSFGGGRALEFVARAIDDEDPSVRLYALRHLVSHRYAPALPRVVERMRAAGPDRSLTERRLLYEAYGALGGDEVVEDLVDRLRARRRWFRKRDPEEIACLLIGLGATGAGAARAAVEQVRGDRHPLVARVAEQVLASWGRATEEVP